MSEGRQQFYLVQIRQRISQKLLRLGLISAAVAIVSFTLGVLLFPAFARLSGGAAEAIDWTLLDGYAGLITVALVIGGLVFALLEYARSEVEQEREHAQTSFSIYQAMHDRLTDPKEEAARRWIIQMVPKRRADEPQDEWLRQVHTLICEKPQEWHPELAPGQIHVKRVLNTFDFLGFVADNYWPVEGALLVWMSPPIAKVWERIGPYVEQQATRRREPDFYRSARAIGERCVRWRKDSGLPEAVVVEDAF